ncbi:molybdenum cofactor guanylyltransferase MobA [Sulfurimonas autotrophica]|uniref:Probable molybdenum cofactor guanylyltransferase n=1 Tax=Sulfurimonas autotrophica (strain ATCC BAA-671 / DSM 16294 / JCM 11897 / OK10) TaxID=563040 RepID=E0URW7_SULAO|nr:molybdenum cofactor guanylyltransferase MobA [Sulfurimonas autotrophica]ADN10131.1 molybdopterin-guanine dinucleotide biosynthesis protein A [Sulfurimonas autotrophica DSM 16294]
MLDIPCVIFAGGKSSRMGEDKALLPFAGFNTLTEYQYTRLSKIFSSVYISCKDKSIFSFDANFIEDDKSSSVFAPTLGFITIFNALDAKKIFAISVDTPFIAQKEIQNIVLADNSLYDAVIAKTDEGIQPLCGIYTKNLKPKFLQMLNENSHRLGHLLKKSKTTYVYFPDTKPFLNMNHPQDYKDALQILTHY